MWTNKSRGTAKEARIMNRAKKQGMIAFRSAGSHSPIDVCAIDYQNAIITFTQSKITKNAYISPKEMEEYTKIKELINGKLFLVKYVIDVSASQTREKDGDSS